MAQSDIAAYFSEKVSDESVIGFLREIRDV